MELSRLSLEIRETPESIFYLLERDIVADRRESPKSWRIPWSNGMGMTGVLGPLKYTPPLDHPAWAAFKWEGRCLKVAFASEAAETSRVINGNDGALTIVIYDRYVGDSVLELEWSEPALLYAVKLMLKTLMDRYGNHPSFVRKQVKPYIDDLAKLEDGIKREAQEHINRLSLRLVRSPVITDGLAIASAEATHHPKPDAEAAGCMKLPSASLIVAAHVSDVGHWFRVRTEPRHAEPYNIIPWPGGSGEIRLTTRSEGIGPRGMDAFGLEGWTGWGGRLIYDASFALAGGSSEYVHKWAIRVDVAPEYYLYPAHTRIALEWEVPALIDYVRETVAELTAWRPSERAPYSTSREAQMFLAALGAMEHDIRDVIEEHRRGLLNPSDPPAVPSPSGPNGETGSERAASARVPKRQGEFDAWRAVYQRVRPYAKEAGKTRAVHGWLKTLNTGTNKWTPCEKILGDILKAGRAGLLDHDPTVNL